MLFTFPLVLLSTLSIASPVSKKSSKAAEPIIIKGVLDNLNGGISKTNKDITSWKGDAPGVELIFQDASFLLSDIRRGAAAVASSAQISMFDRQDWLKPAYDLDTNLDKLINSLISKKSKFDSINRSRDILIQIEQIKPAVDELVKNIFAKLPAAAALLARPVSNQVTGKVDKALRAYQPAKSAFGAPSSAFGAPNSPPSLGSSWNGGNRPGFSQPPASSAPSWSSAPTPAQPTWPNSQPQNYAPQQQGPGSSWGSRF